MTIFETTDYKGRVFDRFEARQAVGYAPGWLVYGRNPEYGDRLIKVCARPNVKPRKFKLWNGLVRRGWKTKREAQAVAEAMNAGRFDLA